MFPNELLQRFLKAFIKQSNGEITMGVDPSANETGKSIIIVGNAVNATFITPTSGKRLVVKGMFINGNGNSGTATIEGAVSGEIFIKSYFANNTSGIAPSDTVNLVLGVDESVLLRTVARGATDETFFGVSVIEID